MTQAQTTQAPAKKLKPVNVLKYLVNGEPRSENYTRFSELTARQNELLKEGVSVTIEPRMGEVKTQVSIVTVE